MSATDYQSADQAIRSCGLPESPCSARFVVVTRPELGLWWIKDRLEDCLICECRNPTSAADIAMGMNIAAEIQPRLVDDDLRLEDALRNTPRGGTGSLTRRHTLRGALDYGLAVSQWISRRQAQLARPNACISDGPADAHKSTSSAEGPFAARNG